MPSPVRVRFAPSPTGPLHLGNARTALFNWLFARKHQGSFILRIEDTDRERSSKEAEATIIEDLRWLGLGWNEGPDVGGPHAPYRQSERLALYREKAEGLLREGSAYWCFCTPDELESRRQEQLARGERPRYDGRCARLAQSEVETRREAGEPAALRFRVPAGVLQISDLVKGEVQFLGEDLGDFVILRSGGLPAYNFAAAVDDAAMAITHVVRGEDHLPNTPRQLLLYRALGEPVPAFAHVPLILGVDRTPLSKRHGAVSLCEYRTMGYLAEAMANYLALLGWSPGTTEEIFSLHQLVERFSLERVAVASATFDQAKLRWLNSRYLHRTPPPQLVALVDGQLRAVGVDPDNDPAWIEQACGTLRDEVEDLRGLARTIASLSREPDPAAAREELALDQARKPLLALQEELSHTVLSTEDEVPGLIKRLEARTGLRGRALLEPIRLALTGQLHGPALAKLLVLLGPERIRPRLGRALDLTSSAAR